jgi:Tol biopolymer transport system component
MKTKPRSFSGPTLRQPCGILLGTLLSLSAGFASIAADETPKFPSNEVMRHFRAMRQPQLSPDGTQALVEIHDAAADGGKSHLWLIDIGGKAPRQLTFSADSDKKGEHSGQWSADGHRIFFLAHRGEHTGLFMLPMEGGEAKALDLKVHPMVDDSKDKDAIPPAKPGAAREPVEDLPVDVASYVPSPDGKWIAFSARDPETPGEKKQKEAKADAEWVDHDTHGTRLYLLHLDKSQVTSVPVPPEVDDYAWKPDSSGLIALVEGVHNAGDLGFARTCWVLETADPEHPRKVATLPSSIAKVTWSVDGQSVIYPAQARRDAPPGYNDLYVSDLGATPRTRDLTDGLDASLGNDLPIALPDGGLVQLVARGFNARAAVFPAGGGQPRYLEPWHGFDARRRVVEFIEKAFGH